MPIRPIAATASAASGTVAWDVVPRPQPESVWRRVRRLAVVAVAGILLLAGTVSTARTIAGWIGHPGAAPAQPALVSDTQWAGAAVVDAVDYLSWDQSDQVSRHAALTRIAAPATTIEGWDGTGRQWAEGAAAIGIARAGATQALVTVRARVIPFTATPGTSGLSAPPSAAVGGPVASAPNLSVTGWAEQPARWITLAIALADQAGQLVVNAPPALVGSPPATAPGPAVASLSAAEDDAFEQASQPTVATLLGAYASGDLAYARAAGTTYGGLDGAASLVSLGSWRVTPLGPGADPTVRVGDATVTWRLAGGAGELTCSYRVELQLQDGRWYLGRITGETKVVG